MKQRVAVCLILFLILSGCSQFTTPKIEIRDLSVREARVSSLSAADLNFRCICDIDMGDTISYAYMTIHNTGFVPDHLLKIETEAAVSVEMRQPGNLSDNAFYTVLLDSVEIPPGGSVSFLQGQHEIVLAGVIDDLVPGQKIEIKLFFERYGEVVVEAEVSSRE
jgi:copper(I)-binding protein